MIPGMLKIGEDTDFTIIASDVIYPTGSGNEYDDKFFRPYQDYRAPIYAIPGNHDWYDGLGGFMRVFCDAPALKARREGFRLSPSGLRGLLWRKPEKIDEERLARARERRSLPGQQAVQPGPYWAMETPGWSSWEWTPGSSATSTASRPTGSGRSRSTPAQGARHRQAHLHPQRVQAVEAGGRRHGRRHRARPPAQLRRGHRRRRAQLPALPGQGRRPDDPVHRGGRIRGVHPRHPHHPRVTVGDVHEDDYKCYPLRGDSLSFYSKLYSDRLRMRWLYLTPDEALCLMSKHIGNTPPRPIDGVKITRRMRWAARVLGAWPLPIRLPVDKVFHRYLSELSDWDNPPFFKSFLHLAVTPETLRIRCFAATGCRPQEIEPPLEDEVCIPLT
nr:hypothetical protein GCM10020093_040190 [Planobispora longispora]